jgi:glycosyltransferase involved in cell wall biosynthesis
LKQNLVQKAEALGLSDSVHFIGHVNEVRPYYEAGEIFVLSSAKEGLPLVLLEAMAYGVPCIATNVGGNAEVIAHGETGFIVESANPEQLANAILELTGNADLRRRMGAKGKERVQRDFNIDDTMARLSEIILN